jgi:very-short-patch-repair endonuclease
MSRGGGREDDRPERTPPARATQQRPVWLTAEERARFTALGPARFQDKGYQRYVQSFRSAASLSESGKRGWAATVATHGDEFAHDRAADKRRATPSGDERRMLLLLRHLDAPEARREYKVAPRTHVDVAWPARGQVIEVYGGVHFGPYFDPSGERTAYDRAREDRIKGLGWEVLVVTHEDLRRENLDKTMDLVRQFLALEERR